MACANILPQLVRGMDTKHPDAIAVDRLGETRIKAHFNITRQAVAYWRANGVPRMHRKTLAMLGAMHGVPMPEMGEP